MSRSAANRAARAHLRSARWSLAVPVLLLGAALATPAHAQLQVSARRNDRESFTNAQVDQAMRRATNAIRSTCNISFQRQGNLGSFTGPNNPGTDSELTTVLNVSSLVKVVNDVRFCDVSDVNYIGCADTGGFTAVVEDVSDPGNNRQFPEIDGILWAHEIGHAFGLRHRDSATALMNPGGGTETTRVNARECNTFMVNSRPRVVMRVDGPFDPRTAPDAEEQSDPDPAALPIEEFVNRTMIDETPVDEILRYGSADLPSLLRMLSDRRVAHTWPMVTTVLGMIGNDATASDLIAFIETRRTGRITRAEYNGVRSAIQALGFLANRAGSPVALDYLMKASDPAFWGRQSGMRWISVATPSLGHRDHMLANVALMGLGLSGDPQAMAMLQTRWNETVRGRASQTQEEQRDMMGLLEQAMRDNAKVSRVGLVEYYRK